MWYLSRLPSLREARQNNNNKRYLPRLGGAHRWPSNWEAQCFASRWCGHMCGLSNYILLPPFAVWKRERSHEILSPPRLQCDPLSVDLVLYRCKNKEVIFFIPGYVYVCVGCHITWKSPCLAYYQIFGAQLRELILFFENRIYYV